MVRYSLDLHSFPVLLFQIWLNAVFYLAVEKITFLIKLHIITIQFGLSFPSFNFCPFCLMLDTGDKEILRPAFISVSLLFYVLKWCLLQLAFSLRWAISKLLCLGEVFLNSLLWIAPSSVMFWWWKQSLHKVYKIMLMGSFYLIHYLNIHVVTSLCFFWSGLFTRLYAQYWFRFNHFFRFSLGCVYV